MCDRYNIQFKHATPQKIDLFALTLFEIIKHSQNFKDKSIWDILLMLDIPKDLHYIFKDRLKKLIPVMVNKSENGPFIESRVNSCELLSSIESYSLTPMGEEAYNSKEILEESQHLSEVYIYDTLNNSLTKTKNKTDSQNAIMVEMEPLAEDDVTDTFMRIIDKDRKKYIKDANPKTMIFDLIAAPIDKVGIPNKISVSIYGEKLKFENDNKKIQKAFLSVSTEEKNSIRNKMFNYLDIPQTKINFDRAKLAVKRSQPIKMKVAFGKKVAIDAVTDTVSVFDIAQLGYNNASDFCFAGITDNGKLLVYHYCEITEQGYTLPLEEFDYSTQSYISAFSSVFENCKTDIEKDRNLEDLIKFAILASPLEQKASVITSVMGQTKDLRSVFEKAKVILDIASGDKITGDKVKNIILDLIKENLSKGSIDADAVIGIMKEINLPQESTIKILAESSPKTDKTINTLLAIDEPATVRIYELVKLYNSLLRDGRLSDITHNTNIYSAFSDYDRQYKKLQTFGFENYYKYDVPKNWDEFMKEVYILKGMFNRLKDKLEKDIIKQVLDFFTKVQDDYDALAPIIDEKAVKKLLDDGDLFQVIKAEKSDVHLIAFAIRHKYEEALRALEKAKDPKANGERKGRTLISYTVDSKNVDDINTNWRNLCTLVHKTTEANSPLWKGSDEDRKKALNRALTCYHQKLASKEKKKEKKK
jgi:hypothetical protein